MIFSENISSVVIYDDVETGVMLHNNPSGRPTKANIRDVTLAEKVEDLRIAHGSDSKMVLLLSFSTDKMIRGMQMYPEVWFLDVTGRANKQKRSLFVLVGRKPCGSSFIANVTLIPSGVYFSCGVVVLLLPTHPIPVN